MHFDPKQEIHPCTVCGGQANVLRREFRVGTVVDCSWCGGYEVDHVVADDAELPITRPQRRALARYLVRQMNGALVPASRGLINRPVLNREFFASLALRALPTPAEASDNMVLLLAKLADGRPGKSLSITSAAPEIISAVGVVDENDTSWLMRNLIAMGMFEGQIGAGITNGHLTGRGWERYGELQRSDSAAKFAFFARRFQNEDLDRVYRDCLLDAVRDTGFELRTVTQRAGLIDAVIEDEIRRCSFVVADLSDDNAGAYWEAGFAEGLGKPVIYLCKAKEGDHEKKTHFDANHRQTVRWELSSLDRTANQLKAIIRNTLIGVAKQTD